jgi:hypothetical protein
LVPIGHWERDLLLLDGVLLTQTASSSLLTEVLHTVKIKITTEYKEMGCIYLSKYKEKLKKSVMKYEEE